MHLMVHVIQVDPAGVGAVHDHGVEFRKDETYVAAVALREEALVRPSHSPFRR